MVRTVLLCAFLALVPVKGNAEEIHKCVSDDGIVYQGHPCSGREAPLSAVAATAARSIPECAPRPSAPPRLPWRQGTICIGMTDDEILNLPGWGPPDRIVRTRDRLWHEDWTYENRFAVPRILHFVNAKLTGVDPAAIDNADDTLVRSRQLGDLQASNQRVDDIFTVR